MYYTDLLLTFSTTAVHIDDNEVTNDSVITDVPSSTFNRTK